MLLSEIAARDKDCTNGRIAAFLLEHFNEIKQDSIRELAAKMHESPSSISRFCREIGLQDFNEMKGQLIEIPPRFEVCSAAVDREQQKKEYVDAVQDSLEWIRKSLDMEKVYQLAADIRRYPRVAAFGPVNEETAAMNLQCDLAMQGRQITTKVRFAQQQEYLSEADENDLIIIFSFSGTFYGYGIPKGYRQDRKRRPKVYVITSAIRPVYPQLYDEVIWFKSLPRQMFLPFQLQIVSSLISQSYAHLLREERHNQETTEE